MTVVRPSPALAEPKASARSAPTAAASADNGIEGSSASHGLNSILEATAMDMEDGIEVSWACRDGLRVTLEDAATNLGASLG
eukprot:CAMPEP_0169249706 /NCGR_PEP_ID=MMETSP1016-20121227/36548_1 /TAXON_ID=342587 /ORGANISM="Karlodinium micrum, Strain CCMP2283" /LENGTH=81 /DNA_ID=CAMNT_0009330645 /DNA_START=440 /DNA_END=685 /DNA_ORIENTATION=-